MRRIAVLSALVALGLGLLAAPGYLAMRTQAQPDFTHFESAHVHPAAMTPDGARLLVVNTPDGKLSVFDVTGASPWRVAEIPVGLEPVSVAVLDDRTAWVVNNLSDDVSIVDLVTLRVTSTLRVGDEPNDVVFAGTPKRAYVSVSQEDRIRVYDPANLMAPPVNVAIDGRYPRSLATNAAGTAVYAAVFFAGNRTSVLSFQEVPPDSQPQDPQFPRDPALTAAHGAAPRVGLIVQQQGNDWRDMYGKLWNYRAPYRMHDVDVAEIPTGATTASRTWGDLGAVNYAIAVSPTDGRVALAGTEARNLLRFEPRLKGHSVDTQVSFIPQAGAPRVVNLNPHVNYAGPGTQAERDSALGTPTGIAWSTDGQRAYVTALASDKLGVLDPATGAIKARVRTVAGPTGVVVDDARGRIYVVGRFRNQLQTLSSSTLGEIARTVIGFDPTPDKIVNGRKFFYGGFTSAHGEQSCASCHVFGDLDNLAWDLGNPAGHFIPPVAGMNDTLNEGFDPMKGPMTTQSLRALPGTGRLHWRADRLDLHAFNPAFMDLMGRATMLPDSEMTAFSDFVNALVYPPNPYQHLNRVMPDAPMGQPSALRGQSFFFNRPVDSDRTCSFCHKMPIGTDGQVISDGRILQDQDMKTPQLRNLYKKTGFDETPGGVSKRGFGFTHDGSFPSVFAFLHQRNFEFDPGPDGDLARRDVEAFVLAFDTGTAPAVGTEITFDAANKTQPALIARLDTLRGQSELQFCDLVAQGRIGGQTRGWWYRNNGMWQSDKASEGTVPTAQLLALAGTGSELTVMGVPPGSGARMANDRDRDGHFDGDERDAGSDPGDMASMPMPGNARPTASAGADLSVTLPGMATLAGSASDDGGTPSVRWTKRSGPGVVTFGNPLAAATTASFSLAGTYELELRASDGVLSTSDAVTVVAAPACAITTLERRVAAGADDGEESASGGVSLSSSDLELTYDGSLQTIGIRFTGVAIPQGAAIAKAWVQFTSHEVHSEATGLRIEGQDADSALAFTTTSRNVSARPRTDAFATWAPAPWTAAGLAGAEQRTPDLTAVIQEIVDRPGWTGRSLALLVTGTGHRTAKAFDNSATAAALLHVEYGCSNVNRRPVVDAGIDRSVGYDPDLRTGDPSFTSYAVAGPGGGPKLEHDIPSLLLNGLVSDDGLPSPPGRVTTTWRLVDGPGIVAFEDSLMARTIVTFPGAGVYVLGLTASDGALATTDEITVTVYAMANVVERAVQAGSDDAEEGPTGTVTLGSSDLDLMLDGSSALRAVGLRFPTLAIPPRATITAAWLQFKAKEAQDEPTTLTVRAQASDNAPTFSASAGDISGRALGTAQATWSSVPAWTSGAMTAAQRTVDISAVIQEIADRPGWMGGNAIALVITGSGRRVANAFESGAANAPVLHVEYTTRSMVLHPPLVGGQMVLAGPDTTVLLSGAAMLRASVLDPRLRVPPLIMWRRINGPGIVTFERPGNWVTRATFSAVGTYRLEFMGMDGMLHSADTTTVTVINPVASLEARVATGADDVEEQASGSVSLTSSDLEMMLDGSSAQRAVGVRFTNLAIPPGAVVTGAWVQFRAKEAHTDATTLTVRGHAHDNAPAFTSASGNVTTRALTTAQAAWPGIPGWVVSQATAAQRTPELKDVVQEIVNRPGWASGNAMALVLTGSGRRVANAFESGAANAPLLHVDFLTAPPPPPAGNDPPMAHAGPDTTIMLGTPAYLHGMASDDGRPSPMMTHWSPLSGPGLVTFENHMMLVTRANFGAVGTYVLELMAMDGQLEAVDSIVVTVVPETPLDRAPNAALAATPTQGLAPLIATLDASASTDADGDTLTYTFDFGDGTNAGPTRSPIVSHGYTAGSWTATVVVSDGRGMADTATTVVLALANLVKNPSFESALTGWNANGTGATVARVAGGHHGGFSIEARGDSSLTTFGINDAPNVVSPVAGAGALYRFSAWVRSASHAGKAQIKVREYVSGVQQGNPYYSTAVTLAPGWQRITLDVAATVAGSTLDFQVVDKPAATREVFQVDEVAVHVVPPATTLLGGDGESLEGEDPDAHHHHHHGMTPAVTRLGAVFPNPSAGATTVRFELARAAHVALEVYDLRGALVRRIAGDDRDAGAYSVAWDGRDGAGRKLPRGIYLVRFSAGQHRESRKLVVMP